MTMKKRLQDPSINFYDAALDLKALRDNFGDEREVLVSESLAKGLDKNGILKLKDFEDERKEWLTRIRET